MPCVSGECNIISRISVDFFLLDFSPLGDEEGRITCVLFLNIAFIFSLELAKFIINQHFFSFFMHSGSPQVIMSIAFNVGG